MFRAAPDLGLPYSEEASWISYPHEILDNRDFVESPYVSTRPEFGVRTPDGVFDVWVHPAVGEYELRATREELIDAVGLWRTAPMVPMEQISLN